MGAAASGDHDSTSAGWSTDDGWSTSRFVGRKSQIILPTARDVLTRLLLEAAPVELSDGVYEGE